MYVYIMLKRKDISHDHIKTVVAAYQSKKDYMAISKQFEVYHSTVRKIIYKWRAFNCQFFQEWVSRQSASKVRLVRDAKKKQELHHDTYRPL